MTKARHSITICMGSSCFSRGNSTNVEIIESFLARYGLAATVEDDGGGTELRGTLCGERCKDGPIVIIDGEVHRRVTPALLPDLLAELLEKEA